MINNEFRIQRRIKNTNEKTPLIVPSFSSTLKTDPNEIGRIHQGVSEYIFKVSLVSAYDLYYDYINIENISCSNLVFIDSGKYETEILKNSRLLQKWNRDLYLNLINKLTSLNQFVITSYDKKEPTESQLISANKLFDEINHLEFAKCFLYKPLSKKSNTIFVKDIQKNIDQFSDFDIIGLADKEIGDSLVNRCKTIVKIRSILCENGIDIPLHIFGSLDPLTIISYFLCGADVFDGLAWLKYTFYNQLAFYSNNYSLLNKQWTKSYDDIEMLNAKENLNTLDTLSTRLNNFNKTKKYESLYLTSHVLQQVKSLTGTAGIEY